jgi:hypothetical protein
VIEQILRPCGLWCPASPWAPPTDRHTRRLDLAWLPDGKRVLTGPSLRLWDADSGEQLRAYYGGPRLPYCCAVSRDGRLALVGGGTAATQGASSRRLGRS